MTSGATWACEALTVELGDSIVLDRISIAGEAGAVTVVVGPSGAGKTTLLRTLAGLTRPSSGRVLLDGCDVGGVPPHRRGVAMMFQEPRLFASIDVADNVAFPLRMQKVPRHTRRRLAAELLGDVGLDGFAGRGVRTLSGGEQQRVALARALAAQPRLLLLDEPTASVDAPRGAELRRLLREVQKRFALSVVAVTHDQAEAAEVADRLVVLLAGEVAQADAPRAVFDRPASVAVARFLGAHNLVRVDVRDGSALLGEVRVNVIGGDGAAALAIRPEQVRITPDGAWKLRVDQVTFCGSHERVALGDGALRLRAHLPVGTAPAAGAVVAVDLPAEALWAIPAAAAVQRA